jgi:hypothetical protein
MGPNLLPALCGHLQLEEFRVSLTPKSETETEDLPKEEIEASKQRNRINALVLAGALAIITLAPDPYRLFAPLLFLIPVILSLVNHLRKSSNGSPAQTASFPPQKEMPKSGVSDPYSYTPRDPRDPRRYRPIG